MNLQGWFAILLGMFCGASPVALQAQNSTKGAGPEIEPRAVLFEKGHSSWRVVITPDKKTLVSSCAGFGGVRFWDVDKKAARDATPGHTGRGVRALALSADGKRAASGGTSDRKVFLWDVASGMTTKELGEHKERIVAVHFTRDGKQLLSASYEGDIKLWDLASGKEVATLFGRLHNVEQVEMSPDGKLLAVAPGTRGAAVTLWDVVKDKAVHSLQDLRNNQGIGPVRFAPDGRSVAVAWGNVEPKLGLWDVVTGKPTASLDLKSYYAMEFSPDGKHIAIAVPGPTNGEAEIQLWDLAAKKTVATFVGVAQVQWLTFSQDGRILIAGSQEHRIRLWDVPPAKE